MIQPEQIMLRPVTEADSGFLFSVYASTREQEMALVPWTTEQKETFVRMQFEAQQRHYAAEHPRAQHAVICLDQSPVGRIYFDPNSEAFHILDVTVLPQYRNQGIGSILLGRILEQARATAKPVTIYVESYNPSLRLFERLGFSRAAENGLNLLMKWTGDGISERPKLPELPERQD
jgi:ribosomal protein S18 acetylase RimI-like enzyme